MNTIPSNNDYPHAVWWTYSEDKVEYQYNPTACLAGFFLRYGDQGNDFYATAFQIAQEAFEFWLSRMPYTEQHVTACFIRLYEYCVEAGIEIGDMVQFRQKLREQVRYELTSVADLWGSEYVCMPSDLIDTKNSFYYDEIRELIQRECARICTNQLEDGSYDIPWQWWNDYKEFEIAKNWWKSNFCIKYMVFLREFGNQ